MIRLSKITALAIATAPIVSATVASAQTAPPAVPGAAKPIAGVQPEYVKVPEFDEKKRKKDIWTPSLSVGATASFANNADVVGQVNGSSFALGLKVDAALDYNRFEHEWRNTLGILSGVARTPIIDEFVKTSDLLALESIYLYHIVPWFGPFGRLTARTAMFRGADVRPAPVTYAITRPDGTIDTQAASRLPLSDPFQPMTLKQSLGVFAQPYRSDPVSFEVRVGGGAQEIIANNQLAVTDDAATSDIIEVKQLSSVNQLGAEVALSVWGELAGKKVTYKVEGNALTPFVYTALAANDTRSAIELTNIQIDGALSFKLAEWASLDYQLRVLRQPQVLDAFQVQNNLLLTFGFFFGQKPPEEPKCPPAPEEKAPEKKAPEKAPAETPEAAPAEAPAEAPPSP